MTSFKKYVAAKAKVNEQALPKTMNQNYFIRKEINEYDGEASLEGGYIDAIVFGALAIMGRSLKNGLVYARLQSLKGSYLEQYELCGSSSSKTVFDDTFKSKKLDEFKDKENTLKDAKEKIKEAADKQKESIEGRSAADTKKREIIDNQADIKFLQIEKAEQQLKTAKSRLNDEVQNKWEQEGRKLDEIKEKIAKVEDGFLLGGTFKQRWDNEISKAKLDIDQKVTELAREILTARDDKDALKELDAREAKLKEKIAQKEKEAKELEANEEDDKAVEAIKLVPTLPKLESARQEFTNFLNDLKKDYEPEVKEETKESISYIKEETNSDDASPSDVISLMSKAYNNQTDENKPAFADKIVKNIERIREFKRRIADLMKEAAEECVKNAGELPSKIKNAFLKDDKIKPEIQENVDKVDNYLKDDLDKWKNAAKDEDSDKDLKKEPEESETSEEKELKKKVNDLKSEIEELKSALSDIKDKNKKSAIVGAISGKEKMLQRTEKQLEELKNKSQPTPESVSPNILKKFMKFEDYLAIKQKDK